MEAEAGSVVLGLGLLGTGLAATVAAISGRFPDQRSWLFGVGAFFAAWGLLLMFGVL